MMCSGSKTFIGPRNNLEKWKKITHKYQPITGLMFSFSLYTLRGRCFSRCCFYPLMSIRAYLIDQNIDVSKYLITKYRKKYLVNVAIKYWSQQYQQLTEPPGPARNKLKFCALLTHVRASLPVLIDLKRAAQIYNEKKKTIYSAWYRTKGEKNFHCYSLTRESLIVRKLIYISSVYIFPETLSNFGNIFSRESAWDASLVEKEGEVKWLQLAPWSSSFCSLWACKEGLRYLRHGLPNACLGETHYQDFHYK